MSTTDTRSRELKPKLGFGRSIEYKVTLCRTAGSCIYDYPELRFDRLTV